MSDKANSPEVEREGHNHFRTDGGPEPAGHQHDRMYPDCPTREAAPEQSDEGEA